MQKLSGKIAVVTGAASGIGYAISVALAREGARVVLGDLNENDGKAVASEVGGTFVHGDLALSGDCHKLIDTCLAQYERLDILVNNAGFQHISSVEEFPEEAWQKMLAVQLTATFILSKKAWPSMRKNHWGRIINIASVHGMVASPFKSAYVAAKHGVLGFTKAAALEGAEQGITVNAICPAYVRTPLVNKQISAQAEKLGIPENDVIQQVMLEPAAIKRLVEPSEVSDLVLYLCSDSARSVTGSNWTIDLGWTAR